GAGSSFTLYLPDTLLSEFFPGVAGLPPLPLPVNAWTAPAILRPVPVNAERQPSAAAHQLDGAMVLIVDDDVRNVFALTSALALHGMTVLYADNGSDGIRMLAEHPDVHVVLMDAMMPDQDGYETTRIIRRSRRFADLPVIFLTAKAMPGDRESAIAAGATDYITKPVDLAELLEMMAAWASPAYPDHPLTQVRA